MPTKDGRKSGGRKKGTPNKATQDVQAICERLKCNPIEIKCHFANGDWNALGYDGPTQTRVTAQGIKVEEDVIPPELRFAAAKELSNYLYPKRKAVEHSGKDGEALPAFRIQIVDAKGN